MKLARLGLDQGPRYAVLDEETNHYIVLADDPMFGKIEPSGQRLAADEVRLVAPMLPRSKVVGLGGAYDTDKVEDLTVFLKPNTAVVGPDQGINFPRWASSISYEAELAIVIGRVAKELPVERAHEAIFGYTLANDVTAGGVPVVLNKVFDASCPLGPVIDTDFDPSDKVLEVKVNGQSAGTRSTAELQISPTQIVSYLSTIFTLLPGDVILTGAGVEAPMSSESDVVDVSLEGIGSMRNRVIRGF
ncbi:fumarylacetoacetate hydrolase family protein [Changpingibacter yushuensis]|uniref:fumarylacetoacetate hydrolase family protein n=1 Tax=Changpingibacter yushuensis TaxID=2758440 RepID=UPI0015F440AC|nr:fumarylacetoacetate hydrolase family protein [Changpingibacter yushuensis]